MRYEPHEYQTFATEFILSHPIAAVLLEMGLGKSVITLTALFDLCLDSFLTINVTVYEASYTNTLVLKNGSTTILTISGLSWSKGTANRTVTLTSAQRTTLLNAMASIKSFIGNEG